MRIRWTWLSLRTILSLLFHDLCVYYWSPYPLQLIRGSILRFIRRLKIIWFPKPKSRGRPPVSEHVVDLIIDMKRENLGWGSLRISNELRILGIKVSKTTVLKILKDNGLIPPRTRFQPVSWSVFLKAYRSVWYADFTTIFDPRGSQIFIFNIIDGATRQLVLSNATLNPTKDWIIQQIRNCEINGFYLPDALVHDRDAIFGKYFNRILSREFGVESVTIGYKKPWQNGLVERYHLTLKTEVLWRIPIYDVARVRDLCVEYQTFYNNHRTHQSLKGKYPADTSNGKSSIEPPNSVKKLPMMNGLVTVFREAA